jgi:hypothetical protein
VQTLGSVAEMAETGLFVSCAVLTFLVP